MRYRPDVLTNLNLPGGKADLDEHGYITNPDNWTREIAHFIADKENITLTEEHWLVLDFMREYLVDHGIMADVRFVLKFLSDRHETNKSGAKKILFDLFPYGYVKQACKIAGMKQPRAWSTG
jgi:TusE/DsrC/DsvC family sulfur relay protein